MKKTKLLLIVGLILMLFVALALCSCGSDNSGSKGSGKNNNQENGKWRTTDEFAKLDVCSKFLASFTTMAKDLSVNELDKGNKTLGLDAKAVVEINNHEFFVALKVKYNWQNRDNTMMSLELCNKEPSDSAYNPDDVIFGAYLYQQILYVAFGLTKFSLELQTKVWNRIFPFSYIETSGAITSSPAGVLATILVLKDDDFVQKKRENGTVTEYNFILDIDTGKTLQRVVSLLDGSLNKDASDEKSLAAFDRICSGVLGISVEDIRGDNIPKSSLRLNFTTTQANKISALEAKLEVDESHNKDTIFGGKEFEVDLNLKKFEIKSFNDVAFPFVNESNSQERAKYAHFLSNSFRLSTREDRLLENGQKEEYMLNITAKIFQEERINNYVFMEYTDLDGNVVVAAAVYRDVAYLFKREGDDLVCTLSMHLDISDIASRVVNNDFGLTELDETTGEVVPVKSELNWLTAIGYLLGALSIQDDRVQFFLDKKFFESVWFNFYDALTFIDNEYEESLYTEIEPIMEFKSFVVDSDFALSLDYEEPFLFVIGNEDATLRASINRVLNAEPEMVLTPIGAEEPAEEEPEGEEE